MRKKKIIDWSALTGLTPEELKELASAAYNTWNYIAGDCLEVNEGKDMRQDEVVEVVMDANYIESNNKLTPNVKTFVGNYKNSPILERYLKAEVFTFAWYGM